MRIRSIIFLLPLAVTAACNNDLFIEESFLEERNFEIDGDGGYCSVHFQPEGLQSIHIDNTYGWNPVAYYDLEGKETASDTPVCELSYMVFSDIDHVFSIGIQGKKMILNSIDNTSEKPMEYVVHLDYGSREEVLTVTAKPGASMVCEDIKYDYAGRTEITPSRHTTTERLKNESDVEVKVTLMPYRKAVRFISLTSDETWIDERWFEIPLPHNYSGYWSDGETWHLSFCQDQMIRPENVDRDLEVDVTVPPRCTVDMTCNYETHVFPFWMTVTSPSSGRKHVVDGTLELSFPTSYDIEIHE